MKHRAPRKTLLPKLHTAVIVALTVLLLGAAVLGAILVR